MPERFDYFVIFGGMRTGSNLLERNLNTLPDVRCFGELYNPYFIAHEKMTEYLGVTLEEREADPMRLVASIREEFRDGLPGFRLFHDHSPRVREAALADPRCAKILLTRNPLESYISWKLARYLDQWVLTDADSRREAKVVFDKTQFREQLEDNTAFFGALRRGLQETGQTAFELTYEDTLRPEVLSGVARFLGSSGTIAALDTSLKKQNPGTMRDKVENYDEMVAALSEFDAFGLSALPSFEPSRGAAVPTWLASEVAPVLVQPVRSSSETGLGAWLSGLGGVRTDMTQKDFRAWSRDAPGATALTVLRHPVARAWAVFAGKVLPTDRKAFADTRGALVQTYGVPLPGEWPDPAFDADRARVAFLAFLRFLKANLAGQTALRIEPAWASQLAIVQGFATVRPPDHVLREDELDATVAGLAARHGLPGPSGSLVDPLPLAGLLDSVYDARVEAAARAAYPRDYLVFGFGDWRG